MDLYPTRFDDCVSGGESTLLDAFQVAQQFRVTHPVEFQSLVKIPASFQTMHYDRFVGFLLVCFCFYYQC